MEKEVVGGVVIGGTMFEKLVPNGSDTQYRVAILDTVDTVLLAGEVDGDTITIDYPPELAGQQIKDDIEAIAEAAEVYIYPRSLYRRAVIGDQIGETGQYQR